MNRRKITFDIVKEEFDKRGYELLSTEYINNATKLQYICPKHKNKGVLEITFANFTKGKGCAYCGGRARKTQNEYVAELAIKKPNIKVIGQYKSLKTTIEHECLICGHRWYVLPDNLLHLTNGCPKCGKRAPLTQDEFIRRVNDIDSTIQILGVYDRQNIKIDFSCSICGNIWSAKPNNILNGKGCPYCRRSKGERFISNCLNEFGISYHIQYKFNDCMDVALLPFDFYIPDRNICIEYDGKQHYEPCTFGGMSIEKSEIAFELAKKHDAIKNNYCKTHNITLIRIPYWDYKNIKNILSSYLH